MKSRFMPLAVLLTLMLIMAVSTAAPVAAQGAYTITVSGQGTAQARPNVASLEFGVEQVSSDSLASYNSAMQTISTVTNALQELGIPETDIQFVSITITPEDRVDAGGRATGEFLYRVRAALRVIVRDIALLRDVTDTGITSGANTIANFTLGVQDLTLLEQVARNEAVSNAEQRAVQIAEQLGVAVGDPITIVEEQVTVTFANALFPTEGQMVVLEQPLEAGELVVNVAVRVTYTLRSRS